MGFRRKPGNWSIGWIWVRAQGSGEFLLGVWLIYKKLLREICVFLLTETSFDDVESDVT